MKSIFRNWICALLPAGLMIIISFGCKSDDEGYPPVLTTTAVSAIDAVSAISGGTVTDDGGSPVKSKGVCWRAGSIPTVSDDKTNDGMGTAAFTSSMTDLSANTTYYIMAYAINDAGVGYGDVLTFTTTNSLTVPCTPDMNTLIFNSMTQHYTTYASGGGGSSFVMDGSGSSSSVSITFSQTPETGIYTTVSVNEGYIGPKECTIDGVFGTGLGYYYGGAPGNSVYVIKNSPGKYSMTFCGQSFSSGSISYTFTTDGNLTTQ